MSIIHKESLRGARGVREFFQFFSASYLQKLKSDVLKIILTSKPLDRGKLK